MTRQRSTIDAEHSETWTSDEYGVLVLYRDPELGRDGCLQLVIGRHDGEPARDWRHLQSIKNEIAGPEREGVELFPAESRLVDKCNFTHLWIAAAGDRLGIGDECGRQLSAQSPATVRQRPWQRGLTTGLARA